MQSLKLPFRLVKTAVVKTPTARQHRVRALRKLEATLLPPHNSSWFLVSCLIQQGIKEVRPNLSFFLTLIKL